MIRVLLADDHPLVRQGMRAVLDTVGDIEVAGEAGDGREAVRQAVELQPDVIVMDLQLPGLHGIEATRQIRTQVPHAAVLVLTMFEDDATVFAAVQAGALGYLVKGADGADIVAAIHAAAAGQPVFGAALAGRLRTWFASPPPQNSPFPELTSRERDILDHLAAGLSNAEIGRHLHLSGKTVANNISAILAKLHLTQRSQAIIRARDAGLGRPR
ncbi:response regulator transcription factor [Streptomyces kebangsaanensis]|uniref:response regulator transcription factor n=1 Tax=Streptomyces kebangsaanensis TaxID=864058 RepID=UPI000ABF2F2C|nr:response regulator transcription factor [Streptomyces kebangsaanensis]